MSVPGLGRVKPRGRTSAVEHTAVSLMGIHGNSSTTLSGRVAGTVNGMAFGPISASKTDSTTTFGDLCPQFTLRWNSGSNNYMTYITGDLPVGAYSSSSLSNIGTGHGAIDAGGRQPEILERAHVR
jgi:hypothetical protein